MASSTESISPTTTRSYNSEKPQMTVKTSSSSDDLLQATMNERKRKRMQSNRESARRSRMRKQKHLDELMGQVTQLRAENSQILETMSVTTQHLLTVEAENSVLRAQMSELSNRLDSLNEMIRFMGSSPPSLAVGGGGGEVGIGHMVDQLLMGSGMAHIDQLLVGGGGSSSSSSSSSSSWFANQQAAMMMGTTAGDYSNHHFLLQNPQVFGY